METEVCATPQAGKPERAKLELSSSPPPNCAICLSDCDNKSFTDKCMHQFCFACLLKWSKVKAECPLCKQPFTSIIHNVRSSNDYEEFTILTHQTSQTAEEFNDDLTDFDTFMLPNVANPQLRQRRFQYRTTLFLDPNEDVAIQRMLLSHPLTNTVYVPGRRLSRRMFRSSVHHSDLDFRNAIYLHNWWVIPSAPDFTGVYRNCSPQFFRENPVQLHRVQPWLMRELNALLNHNMPHTLYVMSIIKNLLTEYHVESLEFRNRIYPYFRERTDHFIHEFYNFLRSPYDMVGYDRFCQYSQRIPAVELYSSSSSSDDDSDVEIISTQHPSIEIVETPPVPTRPLPTEVIEVSDSDSNNSDVILQEPPPPPIITIEDSDDDTSPNNTSETTLGLTPPCCNTTISEFKTERTDEEHLNVPSTSHANENESSMTHGEEDGENSDSWDLYKRSSSKRNKRKRIISNYSSESSSSDSSSSESSDNSSSSYSSRSQNSNSYKYRSKSKRKPYSPKRVRKSRSIRQKFMENHKSEASTSNTCGYKFRNRGAASINPWPETSGNFSSSDSSFD